MPTGSTAAPAEADSGPVVPPGVAESQAAFVRDREALLKTHPGWWVAYARGKRVGKPTETQTELYRFCLTDLGLSHEDFVVRMVTPDDGDEVEAPVR